MTSCIRFDAEPAVNDLVTLDEPALLERIVSVYRYRFLHNPDPTKESWWDFVETVHETLDPDGRTSRDGLTFLVRDLTDEARRISRLLNHVFACASIVWHAPAHPDCLAHLHGALVSDEDLIEVLRVMDRSCPACRAFAFAIGPARLEWGVDALLWLESLENAQDERENSYD